MWRERERERMDTEPAKVIEIVKEKETARKLLGHFRNRLVKNTSSAYYRLDKEGKYRRLQGLLPRLKSCYWPENNYFKMKKSQKRAKGITKATTTSKKRSKGKFQGLIKGVKVHKELKDFVQLDGKNFRKNRKYLHNYSGRILKAIVERKAWKPFLPEFDIFDEELGIGTSIDMVCLDKEGNLILLEFKTGYKGYFEERDGFMRHSLVNFPNTVLNQATLQIVTAGLILERRYEIPLDKMRFYILRIDEEALDIIPVCNDFLSKLGPSIYNDLLEESHRQLQEKNEECKKKKVKAR